MKILQYRHWIPAPVDRMSASAWLYSTGNSYLHQSIGRLPVPSCTVQTSNSCTSRPDVCQCLVVQYRYWIPAPVERTSANTGLYSTRNWYLHQSTGRLPVPGCTVQTLNFCTSLPEVCQCLVVQYRQLISAPVDQTFDWLYSTGNWYLHQSTGRLPVTGCTVQAIDICTSRPDVCQWLVVQYRQLISAPVDRTFASVLLYSTGSWYLHQSTGRLPLSCCTNAHR